MWRVIENIANFNSDKKNEERVLAVMRFEAHAKMFAEWAGENCMEASTIFLQQAIGLIEQEEKKTTKKWKTVRVYQPLALKERGKKW
jgi:hypothetical protein